MDFHKEFFITDEHADNLPTIRIKKIELDNFKSVKHGEILLDCGKQYVPYGTKSDVLGVYGQNGSGKTALIEALSILEILMSGGSVPDVYADCISVGENFSRLDFTFDLQYISGEIRELEYVFSMKKIKLTEDEIQEKYKDAPDDYQIPSEVYRVYIYDEIIKLSWDELGKRKIKQTIIDTSVINAPFGSAPKLKAFIGKDKEAFLNLEINKKLTAEKSRSFIFNKKTLQIFKESGLYSIYYQVLLEMRFFASLFFFVIDTKSSGLIRLNFALPLYTRRGMVHFDVRSPQTFDNDSFDHFNNILSGLSEVLSQLVPGLRIGFKKVNDAITSDGDPGCIAELVAYRNEIELPLRNESDGVRKIISVLSLIVAAYNDQSFTLAIDEFDAGIFEYLLGEILQTFEESGKGQLIFTSHNLRPLEVLNKKFLAFTTTNPNNRYFRLKNIAATNNLRDTYFREIVLGEQEEQIYNKTKSYKISAAMRKARSSIES
ncbi:MAG: AAA family ATPase [Clostridia bacterium]|nr:AAA family ATPase [Clostridia bacterium]